MRLFFKVIPLLGLIYSGYAQAQKSLRPLFLIEHVSQFSLAEYTLTELRETWAIPKNFIHINEVSFCSLRPNKQSLIHICIKEDGEHELLRAQTIILKNSYEIFGLLN